MELLVTGGAGFIGSNFVEFLLTETDYSVTTLDKLTYAGSRDNIEYFLEHPRHSFVQGDVRDESTVGELLEDVDAVVHFAAETHVDRSIENSEVFVSTNVQGTRTLLDAALEHDIDRYVQISTDEVYGQILDGEFTEDDPLAPRNPYSATKASGDLLAQSYHTTHGLPIRIVRPSNNFGPRQHPEKLIPKFITRAEDGKSLPVYGDGRNVREWTYVQDTCRAIELVMEQGTDGEVYNVASGTELQNIEVTRRIIDSLGASEDLLEFVEDRPGHDQRYALDTTKIERLGWEPRWSFDEGLGRTIEHYCSDD